MSLTSIKLSLIAVAATALALSSIGCAGQDEEETPDDESSQEAAFSGMTNVPSDFPSESGWAVSMIAKACDVSTASLRGAIGTIKRTNGGVIYSATRSGDVVASAWAKSTFFAASKRCLSK